ncbi:carbonic anhydrase-like protein [Lotmaria passim]
MGIAMAVRASLLVAALFLAVVLVAGADPHSYHEGNYGTAGFPHTDLSGSAIPWDYTNLNEWPALCRVGSRQSPISFTNVDPSEVVKNAPLKRLQFSSKCFFPKDETQMRIVNEGAVNMVRFERQDRLPEDLSECTVVDPLNKSRIFYFSELHFHATSEHKFRNLRPDVEMHLVFTTDEAKEKKREMLAVAVMLKASTTINSTSVRALRHILVDGSLPRRHAMTTCFLTEDMSITSLIPARESYLLYDGSETHPPCRENVRWVVMTSPVLISRVAVGKLRDAMDQLLPNDFHRFGNARPPQALNGRRIYRFDDTSVPQNGRRNEGNLGDAWNRTRPGMPNELSVARGDVLNVQAAEAEGPEEDSAFASLDTYGDDEKTKEAPRANATASEEAAGSASSLADVAVVVTSKPKAPATVGSSDSAARTAPSASSAGQSMSGERNVTKRAQRKNATADSPATPGIGNSTNNTTAATPSSSSEAEAERAKDKRATNTTTTTTTSTPTSTTTSTTKKPAARKDKKSHESPSKNASETTSDSVSVDDALKSLNGTATGAWSRLKKSASQAMTTVATYVRRWPGRAAIIVLSSVLLLFLICTCIRGWKSPVYVVGIDPRELQPLNSSAAFGQYGGTNDAAVQPAKQQAA